MDLEEWSAIFLKQRDLVKREIERLEKQGSNIIIHRKDGQEKLVAITQHLDAQQLEKNPAVIICPNTRSNVEALAKAWNSFCKHQDLLVVFANTKTNEKWLLRPHLHDRVADDESLKVGLLAMHEAISEA